MPAVLVVDDESLVREFIARTATHAGWTVTEAADADAALTALAGTRFELVCLDVRLPTRDGLWVADVIHERHPGTAVLFLTGVDELPGTKTLRSGVVGYLVKPFSVDELVAILTRLQDSSPEPPPRPHLRLVK